MWLIKFDNGRHLYLRYRPLREFFILFSHLLVTMARPIKPGGA